MSAPTISAPDPTTGKPPRRRRWIPYSLRIFVGFLGLLMVGTLWIGVRGYRQRTALAEIDALQGKVETRPRGPERLRARWGDDWTKSFDEVSHVNLAHTRTSDDTLSHVNGLADLGHLVLDDTQVTDSGLDYLKTLKHLNALSLSNTNVTDAGLANLKGLTGLNQLFLDGTQVTDAGLAHLSGLKSLTLLSLERTQVTDAGLDQLRMLPALQVLSLDSTQASDSGLDHFKMLNGLQVLWIDNKQTAESGTAHDAVADLNGAAAKLVQRLDSDVVRRHFGSHDDSNEFESVLCNIIALGGPEAERQLSMKVGRESSEREAAEQRLKEIRLEDDSWSATDDEVDRLSNNLELLTALRRVQKQPDPLSISVALPRDLKADTRSLPTFSVSLKSVDVERIPVWVQLARHFHGTRREAQWRFEVRDQAGNLLPIRPNKDMFRFAGGIKSDGWLRFGHKLTTKLPMGDFVDIPKAGEYTVTILYHPKLPIADETAPRALDYLITFRSVPFKLTVEQGPKRVIKSSRADKERALSLVGKLPNKGVVKIVGGTYDADDYEFIEPDSPAGQLLTMDWRAVPALIESISDETLSRHRKAWGLTMLYTITAERDFEPQHFDASLPGYELRSGKYGGSSSSGGSINPEAQDELIRRWQNFAEEYLNFRDGGQP